MEDTEENLRKKKNYYLKNEFLWLIKYYSEINYNIKLKNCE